MTIFEDLCGFSEQTMAKSGLPGMAFGILHKGQLHTAGLGLTNVDHPLDVTADTLFQIGSVSKTMTGTVAMRLIEQGKLALDGKIRDYIPDFNVQDNEASTQATIFNLLTHTSGWTGDYFHETGRGDDNLMRYAMDMATLPQLAPVGKFFSYSNSSFALLGRIIEVVTGDVFESIMQQMLFDPLELTSATYDPTKVMTHRFAVGHKHTNGVAEVKCPYALPRAVNPMGGIICNIGDLLRYAGFYLRGGKTEQAERLLEVDSIANMHSPHSYIREGFEMGLSWIIGDFAGSKTVWHNGGTVGQLALLTLLPEHDFAFAAVTNSDNGALVYTAVQQQALKLFLGLEAAPQASDSNSVAQAEEDRQQFVGMYSRPLIDFEIGMVGNKLVGIVTQKQAFPSEKAPFDPPQPPMSLVLSDSGLLIQDGVWKGGVIDILRRNDGSVGWLRFGSRLLQKNS